MTILMAESLATGLCYCIAAAQSRFSVALFSAAERESARAETSGLAPSEPPVGSLVVEASAEGRNQESSLQQELPGLSREEDTPASSRVSTTVGVATRIALFKRFAPKRSSEFSTATCCKTRPVLPNAWNERKFTRRSRSRQLNTLLIIYVQLILPATKALAKRWSGTQLPTFH